MKKPTVAWEGRAREGDTVMTPWGEYILVLAIRNANDVLREVGEGQPFGLYRGGHAAERNAMFAIGSDRRRRGHATEE